MSYIPPQALLDLAYSYADEVHCGGADFEAVLALFEAELSAGDFTDADVEYAAEALQEALDVLRFEDCDE